MFETEEFVPGTTYYVNNVTGSASNDGLSWDSAFAEVATAIAASEVVRLAATNVYQRNRIFIAGTATSYATLTALPNYTDVIGVGGDFKGDQSGTVVIGASTTSNGTASLEMRGTTWRNIQFRGGGSGQSAFKCSKMLRCQFIDCAFFNKGAAGDAGVYVYTTGAHNTFRNCWIGDTNATFSYGMYNPHTANWDHCLVEDCFLTGSVAAYYSAAYLQNATVVRRCICIGGVNGIRDASTETTLAGNAFYVGNYCYGSDSTALNAGGMKVTVNPTLRCLGNVCSDQGTGHNQIATS
jgi:hypothetical protein